MLVLYYINIMQFFLYNNRNNPILVGPINIAFAYKLNCKCTMKKQGQVHTVLSTE